LLAVVPASSGCAHYPVNRGVERVQTILPASMEYPQRNDDILLVLAFSGGGTRAAALSYGVLDALARVEIPPPSTPSDSESAPARHTLLDEVDVISSVSGGSFTAAYYGLYGDRTFDDFKDAFLYRNVNAGLILSALFPVNLVRLASRGFGRSDLAAEYYDKILFHGATFGDLYRKNSAAIFIQATDIDDGIYFGFTPYYFAPICSDLMTYPVARAVAASAAFPGPFSAITLKNYAGSCDYQPPAWMAQAIEQRDTTRRDFYVASHLFTYLDSKKKAYIHLVDGGVADNLALRGPLEVILARGGLSGTLQDFGATETRRVVFIIVNAEKDTKTPWGLQNVGPGLLGMLGVASSTMITSYNYETIDLLRRSIAEWSAQNIMANAHPIDFYAIEVGFNSLRDEQEREYFSSIPTSLSLPRNEVDRLIEVAGQILYESEDFRRLVSDLGGHIP
jgi:NTE family protein